MPYFSTFGSLGTGQRIVVSPSGAKGFLATAVGSSLAPSGYNSVDGYLYFPALTDGGTGLSIWGVEATLIQGSTVPANTASTYFVQRDSGSYWAISRTQPVDGFWTRDYTFAFSTPTGTPPTIKQVLGSTYFDLIDWSAALHIGGSPYNDDITLGPEGGRVSGGLGSDILTGSAKDDTFLETSRLNDGNTITGGNGVDALVYDTTADHLGIVINGGIENSQTTAGDTVTGVEAIYATEFDDNIRVLSPDTPYNEFTDTNIETFGGNDKIRGSGRADTIKAGAGDDLIFGGAGQDVVVYSAGHFGTDLFSKEQSNLGAGQVTFGDYQFDVLGTSTDSTGEASVNIKITGPATEGVDNISGVEFFSYDNQTIPLFKIDIFVDRLSNGKGKLYWKLNGERQGAGENIFYDETLVTPDGDYSAIYRIGSHNGKVIELSDYKGESVFSEAQFVQIHGGNRTTDSAGCIVGTKKSGTPLGELLRKLDNLTSQMDTPEELRVVNRIVTNSTYISPHGSLSKPTAESVIKFVSNKDANSGELFLRNTESFYRLPIPIAVHLQGELEQPTIRLSGGGLITKGKDKKLVLSISDFNNPAGLDRNIIVHIKLSMKKEGDGYLSLDKGGASIDSIGGIYEVTIRKHIQDPEQAFYFHANTGATRAADIEVVGYEYQVGRHAPTIPPGQAMLNPDHSAVEISMNSASAGRVSEAHFHELLGL